MKYKNEIIITVIISLLILFLNLINVLQVENDLGKPSTMVLLVIVFSFSAIYIQKNIDKNHKKKKLYYQNLDILKYLAAITIIILHLRPFINYCNELDLAFNNIVSRICVPIFFLITGYFVAKNEKKDFNYINNYIRKIIHLYLVWSLIYVPVVIGTIIKYFPIIMEYISKFNFSIPIFIILLIVSLPFIIFIALIYTGVYYHLWYFPALIFSLLILKKWKQKFNIKYLLAISFVLLLFGATETYYGVLPSMIKNLLAYYYNIFFTTRNCLFFGLFYVVLGYIMGLKKSPYSKYCFEKLIISIFILVFEVILLHDTKRLNSNILVACVPLVYYLFISTIYISNNIKVSLSFRQLSKYYYLIHPMVIFIISVLSSQIYNHPYINIFITLLVTHIITILIIKLKKYIKLPI